MDVQVLDFDLAAAVAECSGQEFGKTAGTFPDYDDQDDVGIGLPARFSAGQGDDPRRSIATSVADCHSSGCLSARQAARQSGRQVGDGRSRSRSASSYSSADRFI
ncbi:hypothetical protein [Streptomyces sp. NBC_01546]|uniref:hypothetical protein n=1 Tax=Streptomyces sp. NBC_01546 TaxID=2975872 RepID=UPI0038648126